MAIKIPRLVEKQGNYFWQPSATLKKAGWQSLALGRDRAAAITAAEARNAEVDAWRVGGAPAVKVKQRIERVTMDELIAAYRKYLDERVEAATLPREKRRVKPMAPTTRRTYGTALNIILQWSTGVLVKSIDGDRVAVLRDALMTPDPDTGDIAHNRAHGTLRVLHTLFEYAIKPLKLIDRNPAAKFDLEAPDPRDQVWDELGGRDDIDALIAGAVAKGYPGVGLAAELAEFTALREGDLLTLPRIRYREIVGLPADQHRQLMGTDGRVMGIALQPKKTRSSTKRWIMVPIAGDLRVRLEAELERTAKLNPAPMTLLVDDKTGRPWAVRQFQRKFADARQWAIAPPATAIAKGVQPRPGLAELEFRDFRRTCVVRLGELNLSDELIGSVTGHSPTTVKKMLEIYMPRTTTQSATAIATRLQHERRDQAEPKEEQA